MEKQSPITISFLHCRQQQNLQTANGYTLLMLLRGSVILSNPAYPLEGDSLLFLSPSFLSPVQCRADTDLLLASIPADFLESSIGTPQCPPALVFQEDCRYLSEKMANLFDHQYNREKPAYIDLLTISCQLLQELALLLAAEKFESVSGSSGSSRAAQMQQWLEQHFREPVQLQDFADTFGMSRQHSSSVFHRETGISFSDYLLQLRLREAQRLLRTTDESITLISGESGFPNIKSFHAAFQRSFQMTPKEYRQQQEKQNGLPERLTPQDLLTASRLLQEHRLIYPMRETTVHLTEEIPMGHSSPFPPVWRDILNVDFSADCLQPEAQHHLTQIQQQMHFSFVRLSNLITSDLIDYFPESRQHRFTKFLRLLDFFRSINLTPMLSLGNSWQVSLQACMITGGGYSRSTESWLQLLRELLDASIRRWGTDWVSTWRFEFYMPESLFGSADSAVFEELFTASLQMIKEKLPAARVGGPALPMGNRSLPRWQAWLRMAAALPVDFISMELWAETVLQEETLPGQFSEPLHTCSVRRLENADTTLAVQKVQQVREMMERSGLREKKLYVSALGITKYHATPAQVGGHCAAYLVKCSLELQSLADGIGCWKALNTEAEYPDEYNFISSGCGLVERNGLRAPSWYAYQFLSALYPRLIFRGPGTCVTTDGSDRFVLLLHNCKNYSSVFCRNYTADLAMEFQNPLLYTSNSAIVEELTLTGLPQKRYRITRYLIGDYHGCLAHVIQQTGALDPNDPTILDYLAGQSLPHRQSHLTDSTGTLTLSLTLQPDEVMMVRLVPEEF